MFSRFDSRVHNSRLIAALITASALFFAAATARAQVSCQDFDPQCQTDGICQADGTCMGTNLPNTTSCDDGNPCTTGDHCNAGQCVGGGNASNTTPCNDFNDCTISDHCDGAGTCVGGSNKNTGDSCSFPGLGACATGTCQSFPVPGFPPFCNATPKDCGDKCHFCNPSTGLCQANTFCSFNPCSSGECNPSTGACVAGHEGASCDDFNACTSNDQCHNGTCQGTAGGTPPPTATPGGATPTPGPGGCVGDCNGDGQVTVDEIITGVNIALGNVDLSECEIFDSNGDSLVTVDEILTAVNEALNGCPHAENTPVPTNTSAPPPTNTHAPATPTATQNPLTPSATPGGNTPSIGARAAGTIETTTEAFQVFPNLISALLGHLPGAGSGGAAMQVLNIPFTCPTNGGGTLTCDQDIVLGVPPSFTPPTYVVTLNNCQVPGTSGTLAFSGTLTIADQTAEVCGIPPDSATITAQNLTIQMPNGTTATLNDFTAGLGLLCFSGSCSCFADNVSFAPTGSITVTGNGTTTQISFGDGSSVNVTVHNFNAQCVPIVYDLEVDGNATLTTNGNAFAATYGAYIVHDDASSGHDMVEVSGDINSACFGDTVTFSTVTDIALGSPCPTAGVVHAFANTSGNTDTITYSGGGVHIDFGAGGSADFGSCTDSQLFACPAS